MLKEGDTPTSYRRLAPTRYLDVEVLRVLFDHGADINASGGEFGNAL